MPDAQRQEYWRDAITKAKMERTVPVFRGLIASDRDYGLREPEWKLIRPFNVEFTDR
jgi:hypothetical protein